MRKLTAILLLLCLTLLGGGCSQLPSTPTDTKIPPTSTKAPNPTLPEETEYPELIIPKGSPAVIDGEIKPGEWDDAAEFELSDGGRLYLKFAEDSLYLAVDAQVPGPVNVGIIRHGELWVLHTSAALGSLIFQPEGDSWRLEKDWVWCCRLTSGEQEHQNLLAEEAWRSTNVYRGEETHSEFQIQISEDQITLAVTNIFLDGSGAAFWPLDLAEEDLLKFSKPPKIGELALFSTAQWANISFNN